MPTKTSSSRRLAAILFADIVGYTTLMQQGESKAMSILNRFKEVTNDKVSQHRGEVIKTYGDGSLILFDSTVDAVRCAHDMQVAFREGVQVPLRIGIHVGEVIKKDQDIFGNGVNIASRVESMGIGGAVLMSADAHRRIKNQESLSTQSLGQFEFKNVEEPIEVFAIANDGFAIPKKEQMKGKFKEKKEVSSKKWIIPAALIALALIALAGYSFLKDSFTSKPTQPDAMAIFPFEVKGSEDIAYLGDGIVDLLSTKLDGMPSINPIDPNRIFNEIESGQSLNRDIDKAQSIAESLGANNFILGNIIELNDELQITASQYDLSGQVINKRSETGSTSSLMSLIDDLTKSLLLEEESAASALNNLAVISSKSLPALKSFLQGEQAFREGDYNSAFDHYKKATELDGTYAMAYIRLRDAASWSPLLTSGNAIDKAIRYEDRLPIKWQEYLQAITLYFTGSQQTEKKYLELIDKYGESREFIYGLAEYLFHFNPIHGRSYLEAKPWLLKAKELDPNNFEVNFHLADIALAQKDSSLIKQLLEESNPNANQWGRFQNISMYIHGDTLSTKIEEYITHDGFKEFFVDILLTAPEDATDWIEFLTLSSKKIRSQQNHQLWLEAYGALYGKEEQAYQASSNILRERSNEWWIAEHTERHYIVPAAMMSGNDYNPMSEHYDSLLTGLQDIDKPRAYFAGVKYAQALGRKKEEKEYRKKLAEANDGISRYKSSKYYQFSLAAYDARLNGDDDLCLSMIDSAFQYSPGFWKSQTDCMDKIFMQVDIYEERGNLEKCIQLLENIPAIWAFSLSKGYATYRLVGLYEKVGERDKAMAKANLFLKDYKDCDDKYKPWVEEVTIFKDRIVKQML